MMRKIEQMIYSILDPTTIQIHPFVKSCDRITELLFEKEIPIDAIKLHRDIYSVIGRSLSKSPNTISRSVERLLKKNVGGFARKNKCHCRERANPEPEC